MIHVDKNDTFNDSSYHLTPGELIRILAEEYKNLTFGEFARQMGIDEDAAIGLISGSRPITRPIAIRLAQVLGGTRDLWLERETRYRRRLTEWARIENENYQ